MPVMTTAHCNGTARGGQVARRIDAPATVGTESCDYEARTRLMDLSVGLVEDLTREGLRPGKGPEGFCGDFQICLPYRGLFVWHVGHDDVVGDSNQVVFVRSGEPYRMSGIRDGYAELIITPSREVLSEIAYCAGETLFQHPLFRQRSCRAQPHLQSLRARFLHWAHRRTDGEDLEADESVLTLLRSSLQLDRRREGVNGGPTARLVLRTKEYLEANLSRRLLLVDIARAVNASPAYLTDLFRRVEGVSLHHYLMQLRLARALVELPHANDLTSLALDLGFSSHSHFTFAFRRTFGCTPSAFRDSTRRAARPSHAAVTAAGLGSRA
jgi:AraC family transcriptional regulator